MSDRIDLKALSARESEQVEWKENVADPLDVERLLTHRFGKLFDTAPKFIKFLAVLLDLMCQEKELVDVFKELLQHD